jgi:heat shock protein HslJ
MRTRLRLALVSFAVIVAGTAGACASSGSPSPLEGRTFVSTRVEGRVLVPGTSIRLSFERGGVGINAGCNSMGGRYEIEGGRIIVREMMSTEMACDPPLMEQDRWVAEMLTRGAAISLSGDTLTLEGSGTRLTMLDRRVAEPDQPLEGTRWVLEGIIEGDSVSSVPAGVTAAIRISDSSVAVEAGCNQGGGSVQVEPGALTFGSLSLTRMACEADRTMVEQAVVSVLSGRVSYRTESDVLTLWTETAGLIFRAAP